MNSHNHHPFAVCCQGLTKSYGSSENRVSALRGIDLEVRQGELMMIVGPSGCGKTTLISIIAAILEQDSGGCEVFGRDLRDLPQNERIDFRRQSVGFVFQIFNLLPTLSASENVSIPLLLNGFSRSSATQKAMTILEQVGLDERVDALPTQLSGGQQQRVAIARALVHDPRLIVCDEPTSNLDHKTGSDMIRVLRSVGRRADRAVIIVTHDTRILEFADRIAHMDDGRIVEVSNGQGRGENA